MEKITLEDVLKCLPKNSEKQYLKDVFSNSLLFKKDLSHETKKEFVEDVFEWIERSFTFNLERSYKEIVFKDLIESDSHILSMAEFEECCKDRSFIDYDGYGLYSDGEKLSNMSIYPSDVLANRHRKEISHVVWFNR